MSIVYTEAAVNAMKGVLNLVTDLVRCNLMVSAHTENKANLGWASVAANEVPAGGGYNQNSADNDLAGNAVNQDDVNDKAVFDADDKTWTDLTITEFRYAVLYDVTSPGDVLLCSIDLGSNTLNNSDITIQWHPDGIFTYG